MKTRKWCEIRDAKLSRAARQRLDEEYVRELEAADLKGLRELAGVTQSELAKLMESTQSQISKLEGRVDHKLSTLRRLVKALGGSLHVVATLGDRTIRLRSLDEEELAS